MIPRSLNLIILILWPFVKTQSFSNFAWFFDRWAKDYVGNDLSLLCFGEAHWSVSTKETRFNRIPQCIIMKGYSRHNSSLIGRKNQAKFDNDRISRNGHRIKTTQPNLMILVSFSSAEDVWSNDVNRYNTFSSQCTENAPFHFFWDTRYCNQMRRRLSMIELLIQCSIFRVSLVRRELIKGMLIGNGKRCLDVNNECPC